MTTHSLKPAARLKPDVKPVCVEGLVEHELEDELVLYDPRTDGTHVLNGAGTVVWFLIDGKRTVAEIGSELAGYYGLDHDSVASDVSEVLLGFRRAGLTTW
ncbi:MAG: PqqD family protein [Chloroflexi bacterium]|nr:PqqD family protein [Chloroflexota bacterium]